MLAEIEVTEPFVVNGAVVKKLTVSPIRFVAFSECLREASRATGENAGSIALARHRRKRQIKAFGKDGHEIPLDDAAFGQMPRRPFVKATEAMDMQDEPQGSIVSTGDGIERPVIYKFGTPLLFTGGESGNGAIEEVEFFAKVGADIEVVLCADAPIDKAIALVSRCATPLGADVTLQALPSWMVSQITMADGLFIMNEVLPSFLD